jgi:hypothetical protein
MKYVNCIIVSLLVVAYDAFLIGGCAYLVFWRGNSAWWFVLAVALLKSVESDGEDKEERK